MDTETRRSLGATIKACRRALGWTQAELADRVAAHGDWTFRQCDVSRLERRVVTLPHRERLIHIAAVLGVPLGELLARSGWAGADTAFSDAEEALPAKTVIASPSAPDGILEAAQNPRNSRTSPKAEARFSDARES
jgi:transcriptional regulator with XRE-family HTH domain